MSRPTLVTGGTGTLGRAVVRRLRSRGHAVRVLSRRPRPPGEPGPDRVIGDLTTGEGVDAAVADVGTVVHCATTNGRGDVRAARLLTEAVRDAEHPPHLVYVSIVGIEAVPLSYYRIKLSCEGIVAGAGVPWTIQRATQFHDLVARPAVAQRRSPIVLAPADVDCQPIDVRDVARRLVELVETGPAGRAPQLGGPEVIALADLTRRTLAAEGRRSRVLSVPLPGAIGRALRSGGLLTRDHAVGEITFDQYLAERTNATHERRH
ncbi:uncharacterized protein YbjT (DUF2867 family) [Actinoalloteichus hoggarensis]|uniref:Short chain dehydrogenase n=1 Tax=Actinoalloteichus hoggarensis TaxID=1470176 RepID=A0A221W5T7_9PSEU|nr:NAD(P)H-binding protein [Actinoalloteichus hoggarensis]ASO21205.1 short chain dehydrogenase [Actinoalloteichus hoggarensis]MBB5921135.1 uncharacterized protein YbjT (DUF2867 family) [Actinoalloteichus hoggarensis]